MDDPRQHMTSSGSPLSASQEEIAHKEARKQKARNQRNSVWFGLGMFGIIGWSIVVPTLFALGCGIWLDRHWKQPFSWTLILLFVGVLLGCYQAWHWISKQGENKDDG